MAEDGAVPVEEDFSQNVPDPLQTPLNGMAANIHNSIQENFCSFPMEDLSYHHHQDVGASTAIEMENGQQMSYNIENSYNNNNLHTHLVGEEIQDSNQVLTFDQSSWDHTGVHEMQDVSFNNHHNQLHNENQQFQPAELQNSNHGYHPSCLPDAPYTTPDFLNLIQLPRSPASSFLTNSSISFANPDQKTAHLHNSLGFLGDLPTGADRTYTPTSQVLYDPLFHLNLPPQPPIFRELLQSLPNGYNLTSSRSGSLFGGGDEIEGSGIVYQDGDGRQFENGVFEFTTELACAGKGREGKTQKHFATEKERRVSLNEKFQALKNLVPNPTKPDRASVVGDAIEYIKELRRTVGELKILVEKKRYGRERSKKHKTEKDAATGDMESCNQRPVGDPDQSYNNGSLRSSWLQRKSKDTEVDVRIIDDDVTIKLVQRKKINCLLFVSKVLDELELDLHHVAGGHIGDSYSFLFSSKIYEGSSVYASAIANKLIQVMDRQFAATPPISTY
ncbi:BHLH transcription factor [Quillaja saponaria]|uniref:BHLH transcription factor n=1 Tax=Quillaja saponaria TaxID=32244 RepID=A0AAD7M3P0_QUISA|nr:BHLH transcription factor [Quillaja saponaria]